MANAVAFTPLSAATTGLQIKVVATSTPGTLIHTTTSSTTVVDRLYLYANNTQAASTATTVLVTVEWGTATAPDGNKIIAIPGQAGDILIVDGLALIGNALTVKVFAATTAVINVSGFVLRITP